MTRYNTKDRIGVNAVEKIVIGDLGWIFREQPIVDMGIDAHVERVDKGRPTGKLIALQIKTGSSYIRKTKRGFFYYGNLTHLDYWTGHSLPVVLVIHLPKTKQTFWSLVNEDCVQRTSNAWKIKISKKNKFDKNAYHSLASIFEGSPAQQRFRELSIHEPLMRHIADDRKVSVDLEDWVNKSLGRTPVKVFIHDEHGNETLSMNWDVTYLGYGIKELTEALFPWAQVELDSDFYEINFDMDEERDRSPLGFHDSDSIYPYAESMGEVERYRLRLDLNELGQAFLAVSDYLSES